VVSNMVAAILFR